MAEALVPAKRPSTDSLAESPAAPTPSTSKRAHLDQQPAPSSSTANGVSNGTVRKHRVAGMFSKPGERKPQELIGMEAGMVDVQLEVEDAAGYPEALLTLQTMVNRLHHPARSHIRMLLALAFFPLLFKPPTKSSNPAFAKSSGSTAVAHAGAAATQSSLLPQSDDPTALSHRKVRELARGLLSNVVGASGVEVVCRAIRGSGVPESQAEREGRIAKEEVEAKREEERARARMAADGADATTSSDAKGKKRAAPPSTKRAAGGADDSDDDDDLLPSVEDEAIAAAGKRIGQCEDLWDFLAGSTARKTRVRTREKPVMEIGGWPVLGVLVKGWEEEHDRKAKDAKDNDPPAPLSLLRYFKPSASSGVAREVSVKALDVVFWPFSPASEPKKAASGSDEEQDDDDEIPEKRDEEQEAEGDGMMLDEKREVAMRLLGLIGASAQDGYLDGPALLSEVVQRLKMLQSDSFAIFVETLSTASIPHALFTRILNAYLESHSQPAHISASLFSLSPSPSLLMSSSGPTSPRKRHLGVNGSLASLTSSDGGSLAPVDADSPAAQQHLQAAYWRCPSLSSPDFLALLARLPIEVPLEAPTSTDGGARRPRAALPSSFARAAAAAEAHKIVKTALLGAMVERETLMEERRRDIEDLLRRVDEKVDEARERVESR
ncbi:hypothetical protein JCM8097_009072 [Rhodosporidiobolus ruineniae]